jgi:hypothetical protein
MRIALVLALAAWPLAVLAEPGSVDWQKRVVRCTGSGAANLRDAGGNPAVARIGAEKAAKLDALRTCLETMKGVAISGSQTVGAAMAGDAAVKGSVEGAVRGFRETGKRYFSDGGVEIDVEVPLDAAGEALLPRGAAAQAPAGPTALVVDATGLKVAPALAPRLLDEAGRELYGPATLGDSARRSSGVAAYAPGLEAARRDLAARLGDRPLVVKALRAQGSDLVLGAEATAQLSPRPAFLAEGRVVILADQAGGVHP